MSAIQHLKYRIAELACAFAAKAASDEVFWPATLILMGVAVLATLALLLMVGSW